MDLTNPQTYSIPSPAISQWHFGVNQTVASYFSEIFCRIHIPFQKSLQLAGIATKLVFSSILPFFSCFEKYCLGQSTCCRWIKPCSTYTFKSPFGFPSQCSTSLDFTILVDGKLLFLHHHTTTSRLLVVGMSSGSKDVINSCALSGTDFSTTLHGFSSLTVFKL